ncbi:MAG: hypothetical protein R2788_20985 [Saprospiraceae bacterium]
MQEPTLKSQFLVVYPFDHYLLHHFVEYVYYEGLFTPYDIDRINNMMRPK